MMMQPKNMQIGALIVGLLWALLSQTAIAGVVVHKSFKESILIANRNLTVRISAFNRGPDAITNLDIHENSFLNLTAYHPVQGKHSRRFASIAVNETKSFWFVVKPSHAGVHQDQPASFKYLDSSKTKHHGFSSSYQAFPVFTEQEAAKLGLKTGTSKWPILAVALGAVAAFVGYVYQETLKEGGFEKGRAVDEQDD
ncbi:translocon-associated protein subunit beta [Chytriomyces sp. MP71]|nr:translocon-associated protein subunit beta [Chytriomyces sp. MP71]